MPPKGRNAGCFEVAGSCHRDQHGAGFFGDLLSGINDVAQTVGSVGQAVSPFLQMGQAVGGSLEHLHKRISRIEAHLASGQRGGGFTDNLLEMPKAPIQEAGNFKVAGSHKRKPSAKKSTQRMIQKNGAGIFSDIFDALS